MKPIRLMTLAPGHFHAALVQKRMPPGVAAKGYVYGPLDADTVAHVDRIRAFNSRPHAPTNWEVDVRAGANWLSRFVREQPGNVVVLSGRNRPKVDLMRVAAENSLHVLADKPWVVDHADFPKLEEVYRAADLREVVVWDAMTERHEVTNRLQRSLVQDPEVFGRWQAGTATTPALKLDSLHHLKKSVAGRPLVRPWWWFDPAISGEGIADVGTHLADLALGFIAGDQPVDYRTDVTHLAAERWPLVLSEAQFHEVTGLPAYPDALADRVVNGQLYYAGNNSATFLLGTVWVRLRTFWDYEAPPDGGDTHAAVALGTRAVVSVRQPQGKWPEVFVAATDTADHPGLVRRVAVKCDSLRPWFPGLAVADLGTEVQILIPDGARAGHEAHFAAVMDEFVRYFHVPRAVPPFERPNTLAKYYITTKAAQLANQNRV